MEEIQMDNDQGAQAEKFILLMDLLFQLQEEAVEKETTIIVEQTQELLVITTQEGTSHPEHTIHQPATPDQKATM